MSVITQEVDELPRLANGVDRGHNPLANSSKGITASLLPPLEPVIFVKASESTSTSIVTDQYEPINVSSAVKAQPTEPVVRSVTVLWSIDSSHAYITGFDKPATLFPEQTKG